MTSRQFQEGRFLTRPTPAPRRAPKKPPITKPPTAVRQPRRRLITLYDAIAGRATTTGPLTPQTPTTAAKARARSRSSTYYSRLRPEEVLFRRKGAPTRYAERDFYFAHEGLANGGVGILPESDMLEAVHLYASLFYEVMRARRGGRRRKRARGKGKGRRKRWREEEGEHMAKGKRRRRRRRTASDFRSMKGSALLAFGILLEEAGREALGRDGDLVFTEGVKRRSRKAGSLLSSSGDDDKPVGFMDGKEFWKRKYKRRKLSHRGGEQERQQQQQKDQATR